MSITQQPDALNIEEFRAKVTRAAREPLLARIAELEAVLSAMGEKGNPVEPADIPRATDQDTHFFLAGWNGRAAQVDPHEHFRNAAATAPAYPAEGVPAQAVELEVDDLIDRLLNAQQDLNLAANVHMDQSIASASTLLDEVEIALRTLADTQPAAQGMDAQTLKHISALSELVRMPNAEYFADVHNAAVRHLRALAAQAKQKD